MTGHPLAGRVCRFRPTAYRVRVTFEIDTVTDAGLATGHKVRARPDGGWDVAGPLRTFLLPASARDGRNLTDVEVIA
jgi:hypothetical protein